MLKVVGASLVQTRLASYILAGLAICGIIIIIFGGKMGSNTYNDGVYSATVYWRNSGYRIEFWGQGNTLDEIPKGTARAYYKPDLYNTGWSKLEIETNADDPDTVQAYSAGLLEGSLTWQLIYWHWQNTINSICEENEDKCEEIREYLRINSDSIRTKAAKLSEFDSYWHQVKLFYAQLDGMEMGWRYAVKRSRQSYEIPPEDFIWMNHAADIMDIATRKFNLSYDGRETELPNLSSAFFKLTNISSESGVHIAQSTAGLYRSMLRTIKRYIFNFHETGQNEILVPGTIVTFTGYPGVISSLDDFYLIKSNEEDNQHSLAITGTKIGNLKIELWENFNPNDQVFTSVRALVASRLTDNGKTWSRYFSQGNSGTDNKQWAILDKSRLNNEAKRKSRRTEGLLWIVEQIPELIYASDMSHVFYKYRYWSSFGMPVFENVRNAIKLKDPSYETDILKSEKAKLFAECRSNCNNPDSILNILRFGINPATNEIGARADLYSENSIPYGLIDTKIYTGTSNKTINFEIFSGPVSSTVEDVKNNEVLEEINESIGNILPFQWSSSKFKDVSHVGQPDIWKFEPFRPVWSWS